MKSYKFVISSLNTEKTINELAKKFDIFDIQKNSEQTSFCCDKKNRKKIKKILQRAGFKIKLNEYFGFFKYFKKIFSIGIICGIIFSFIFFVISSFFITDVLIWGNISFTEKEVMQVLKNNNINKWSLKLNINKQKLQNDLQNIKYVSYASVIVKGNALVINIKEQLTNSQVVDIGEYLPLVSTYDCKITSIKLIQGTSLVKVGDIVHIGQTLVEPYSIDANGKRLSVQPLAEIVADVWFTSEIDYPNQKVVKTYTGNVIKNYRVTFLGISVYEQKQQVEFENYDVQKSEEYLSGTLLPIKIWRETFLEYTFFMVETDFENCKQQFVEQTRQSCLLNLNNYDIIKNESYVITNHDTHNTISYTITLNRKIC